MFKYTTYISDGDSKVYNKFKEENIYDVPLEKMECSNHMAKRASNDLHKFGLKWQPSATAQLPPPLPPSNPKPLLPPLPPSNSAPLTSSLSSLDIAPPPSKPKKRECPSNIEKASRSCKPIQNFFLKSAENTPSKKILKSTAQVYEPVPPPAKKAKKCVQFSYPLITNPTAHSSAHPEQPAQSETRRSGRINVLPTPVYKQSPARPTKSSEKPDNSSKSDEPLTSKPVQKTKRRLKYPLKNYFTWNRCHELSQRYKLAVYQHSDEGPEAQSKAVKAVFYHEQDHTGSSVEEKIEFHQFCGNWCKFKTWESKKKPLAEFTRTKTDIHGNEQVWNGGV